MLGTLVKAQMLTFNSENDVKLWTSLLNSYCLRDSQFGIGAGSTSFVDQIF